jgi:hypothetical protein
VVDITFIVPIALYHEQLAARAVASVHAQTVPCAVITIDDTERRGPGWARNQGLAQVVTEFVAFLDADDTIAPNWAREALVAYEAGSYVYTDWWEDQYIIRAPECPWVVRDKGVMTFHTITTLLRTEDVRRIGGFNEDLPAAEDTDFYRRLVLGNGICGIRVKFPLFYYHKQKDGRSDTFINNQAMHDVISSRSDNQWRGIVPNCAKCGGAHAPAIAIEIPQGAALQEGYVWVQAGWDGNRRHRGIATGNIYPSSGNGKVTQVDARDQHAEPDKYLLIEIDRGWERQRDEPEPGNLERVTYEVVHADSLQQFVMQAFGATEPPPPVYDPYAGQAVSGARVRNLSGVMRKLEEMMG